MRRGTCAVRGYLRTRALTGGLPCCSLRCISFTSAWRDFPWRWPTIGLHRLESSVRPAVPAFGRPAFRALVKASCSAAVTSSSRSSPRSMYMSSLSCWSSSFAAPLCDTCHSFARIMLKVPPLELFCCPLGRKSGTSTKPSNRSAAATSSDSMSSPSARNTCLSMKTYSMSLSATDHSNPRKG